MELGLFLLRAYFGGLILSHGSQKVFGAFGGLGPTGTAPLFEVWGIRPGRPFVILAGVTEIIAGVMLITGFLTPLAAAAAFGTLIVACSVIAENGLWAVRGGYELPLAYAWVMACLGFTGPGGWSLDAAFGLAGYWGVSSGLIAVAIGGAAAAVMILWVRRNLRNGQPA